MDRKLPIPDNLHSFWKTRHFRFDMFSGYAKAENVLSNHPPEQAIAYSQICYISALSSNGATRSPTNWRMRRTDFSIIYIFSVSVGRTKKNVITISLYRVALSYVSVFERNFGIQTKNASGGWYSDWARRRSYRSSLQVSSIIFPSFAAISNRGRRNNRLTRYKSWREDYYIWIFTWL